MAHIYPWREQMRSSFVITISHSIEMPFLYINETNTCKKKTSMKASRQMAIARDFVHFNRTKRLQIVHKYCVSEGKTNERQIKTLEM